MKYPGHKKTLEWYHARVCKTMKKQTQSIKHAVTYFHKHYIRLRLYISFYLLGISMLWLGGEWLIFFAVIPLISYIPHMQKMKLRQVLKDFYFGGVILCGFEQAYNDGKIGWKKPLSCHLFPIKISKSDLDPDLEYVNYEPREDLCSAACGLGKKLKVPVYQFLKEALIRKYGQEFYEALKASAAHLNK